MGLTFDVSGEQNESLSQHLRHSTFLDRASKSFSRCDQEKDEGVFFFFSQNVINILY